MRMTDFPMVRDLGKNVFRSKVGVENVLHLSPMEFNGRE